MRLMPSAPKVAMNDQNLFCSVQYQNDLTGHGTTCQSTQHWHVRSQTSFPLEINNFEHESSTKSTFLIQPHSMPGIGRSLHNICNSNKLAASYITLQAGNSSSTHTRPICLPLLQATKNGRHTGTRAVCHLSLYCSGSINL